MNPGFARILTCPHCGKKKEVLSLISGNTFGARFSSDNKQYAPMLPQVSYIQKCPECGEYFILSRQTVEYGKDYSFELGCLSYKDTKEAVLKLMATDLSDKELFSVLLYFVQAFNDEYHRESEKAVPDEEYVLLCDMIEKVLNITGMWNSTPGSVLFQAELYRESGQFDKATALLDSIDDVDVNLKPIMDVLRVKCTERNNVVFELKS